MENNELTPLGTTKELEETEYPSFELCLSENWDSPLVAQHKQWLKTIRHETPNPKIPFKVAVYIRYFNQTKYSDYLERNKEVFRTTLSQYPMWEFVGFYIDNGSTAPNMESAVAWSELLSDCDDGKVNLIITQKISNISKKIHEVTFCARMLAARNPPVGIYFISEEMKHVRPLRPYEIFMANIEAGNEKQLIIKRLVESYSLSLGPAKAYGVICAVATLERIYTKYSYHVLDRTLRLCVGTWEGDIDSLGGNILAGVARLVVAFGDQLRDETFKEKVGFMSVRQLSRIAKERGAGALGYAEAMLVAYNRKCKYTLRMSKLHSGKVAEERDFVDEAEESLPDTPVLEP